MFNWRSWGDIIPWGIALLFSSVLLFVIYDSHASDSAEGCLLGLRLGDVSHGVPWAGWARDLLQNMESQISSQACLGRCLPDLTRTKEDRTRDQQ